MLLNRVICAGLCACLALPAWAVIAPDYKESPLSISTTAVRKIDPPLQAFIQQLWTESPAVQNAQAALEAASARATGADQPLHNPVLELEAERTDINTTTIGFSQTLDWSDKQDAHTRIANQEVQSAIVNLQEVRQRTAVEALDALVNFFTAKETQSLALRRSQLMKGFIDTVKQRHAAGDMETLDVTFAQVAYSEALMAQAASNSELAEAEAALQAVSGLATARWPQLPRELAPAPEDADFSLLESLPELAMLRNRMEMAKARINLAERESRVDPTIGIRAGREDSDTLLGLSIEIPLFVRNSYQASTRAASHEAVAEEQAYRDVYQRAKARLVGALGRFENITAAWRVWISAGQQAHRDQMTLLEKMWQAGELSATDFFIQAKQNIDTQATATELKGQVWQSAIAWLAATGQIEQWLGLANNSIETNSGETK